ncbi:MAG: ABC transporter ATP-binding protein [Vicinamibacterales bacterium]
MTAEALSWPLASLGEGLEQLARRAGLRPVRSEPIVLPESVLRGSALEFNRWVEWAGGRLGIETDHVDVSAASVETLLLGAGPAVLSFASDDGPRFVMILGSRFGRPRVLCPDLRVRACRLAIVRDVLCGAREAALMPEIDRLLDMARVSRRRIGRVRSLMARERLGDERLAAGWILRLPPSAGFGRLLAEARVPRRLGAMLGVLALMYVLEIAGWRVIGAAALSGRLDLGWLAAWVLLVVSLIPLRLVGGWLDAMLALDVARLIKTRLLVGALRFDIEAVRQQGVGQLLGRVMESQAFESLALNFGVAAIVSTLELGVAAWVLSAGAAGAIHVAMLGGWLLAAVGLSVKYFRRLTAWTDTRLDMTHALVERMVGHKTTLAQESPDRRDEEQDRTIGDYLHVSANLDRAAMPLVGAMPGGWVLLAILGLAPAFVSGSATPASLAISIGGILLANRALSGVTSGLSSAAGAAVAWKQIGPLFRAAVQPGSAAPFVGARHLPASASAALIEADNVTFRYQPQGEPALRSTSLAIQHGERLLIEGPSGGGKTTLASLLVGLRQPDSGMLLLNGLDRFTLGDSWHRLATEAPQFHENHIFSGTLAFNLLMGLAWPASDDDLRRATTVCEELGLGDLLRRMPSGLMQTVGETGWQLSHGERSRIFLARALLQDAQLTVLDESFAALDPESLETCLTCVMRRARTLAVIAHP